MCNLFTLCWGQMIWEVGRTCPPVPVGVHKLAVVLSLAKCVSYTVKRLCGGSDIIIRILLMVSAGKSFDYIWLKIEVKSYVTSKTISHEDLVSQRVTQNHADKLPVPRALDVLAALTAAVGWVILEGKGDPDRFSTWGEEIWDVR